MLPSSNSPLYHELYIKSRGNHSDGIRNSYVHVMYTTGVTTWKLQIRSLIIILVSWLLFVAYFIDDLWKTHVVDTFWVAMLEMRLINCLLRCIISIGHHHSKSNYYFLFDNSIIKIIIIIEIWLSKTRDIITANEMMSDCFIECGPVVIVRNENVNEIWMVWNSDVSGLSAYQKETNKYCIYFQWWWWWWWSMRLVQICASRNMTSLSRVTKSCQNLCVPDCTWCEVQTYHFHKQPQCFFLYSWNEWQTSNLEIHNTSKYVRMSILLVVYEPNNRPNWILGVYYTFDHMYWQLVIRWRQLQNRCSNSRCHELYERKEKSFKFMGFHPSTTETDSIIWSTVTSE